MTDRDECRAHACTTPPGTQDRDDYNSRLFCSVQCETKHDKLRDEARDAKMAAERDMRNRYE
jgi:hypothetical protein